MDICCTLGADDRDARDAWRDVLGVAVDRAEIPGGRRIMFGAAAPLERLARMAADEQECCRFFSFAITVDERGVSLEVTAPDDAAPLVEQLFG